MTGEEAEQHKKLMLKVRLAFEAIERAKIAWDNYAKAKRDQNSDQGLILKANHQNAINQHTIESNALDVWAAKTLFK